MHVNRHSLAASTKLTCQQTELRLRVTSTVADTSTRQLSPALWFCRSCFKACKRLAVGYVQPAARAQLLRGQPSACMQRISPGNTAHGANQSYAKPLRRPSVALKKLCPLAAAAAAAEETQPAERRMEKFCLFILVQLRPNAELTSIDRNLAQNCVRASHLPTDWLWLHQLTELRLHIMSTVIDTSTRLLSPALTLAIADLLLVRKPALNSGSLSVSPEPQCCQSVVRPGRGAPLLPHLASSSLFSFARTPS